MKPHFMLEYPQSEYDTRLDKLLKKMEANHLDAMILTSKENNRYFIGFQSIVWDSKVSTPGVIILSADGKLTFVGAHNARYTMLATACVPEEHILTYSRNPDHHVPTSFMQALTMALEKHGCLGKRMHVGMELGTGFRPHLPYPVLKGVMDLMSGAEIVDAAQLLWEIRAIKSPLEQERFRKACEINVKMYEAAFSSIVPGKTTELDVYHTMGETAFQNGCEGILLMGIICGRDRESQGNCPPSRRIMGSARENEFIMIDGGPSYQGYYSDIIRMGYIGSITREQQEMYDFAVSCTNLALSMMKPGAIAGKVCDAVDARIAASPYHRYNRTKGWIGHSIGLDIHEYPCLESGSRWALQPGMCFSVEPALYNPKVGKFILEQNVIVTQTGCEIVSPFTEKLVQIG